MLLEKRKVQEILYKVDFGIHSGWLVYNLSEFTENGTFKEFIEKDGDDTIIKMNNNEFLNKIDTNWKIIWNPKFDLDYALN